MSFIEMAENGKIILGFVLSSFALIGGFLTWWAKRNRAYANEVKQGITIHHEVIERRLRSVEGSVDDLSNDVELVRKDVGRLERDLTTLARKEDVSALRTDLARLEGSLAAQMSSVTNAVDTLYKAALRANSGETK